MSAKSGRQIARIGPATLRTIRAQALEELAHALVAGADEETTAAIASLIVRCQRRLERLTDRRLDADAPTLARRQQIAGEALAPAPDARGPRRARSSDAGTTARGVDPKIPAGR